MTRRRKFFLAMCLLAMFFVWPGSSVFAATTVPVSGEIQMITVNDPTDVWSAGIITVGGQNVIIPRNLLIDLPANRLTLQQIFAQAPPQCVALGQTGLAKGDSCNTYGAGGFATISANRTNAGDVIAGDVFIEKGRELVSGIVTYIDYTDGYLRVNGILGDAATGAMIRLNDPDSRHTFQQGLGCLAGSFNCSADPRFTLDPDNYVITFTTGYPACIPSTVSRIFTDLLGTGITSSQAGPNGAGDYLCPDTNRPGNNVAVDSRRFAPIIAGDSITAEGNFEIIDGVQFLSTHTMMVHTALETGLGDDQPDYIFLDEVEIDAPSFENERIRALFIGFASQSAADVMLWSIHYNPVDNAPHEFPLGSVLGCDIVGGGGGTCSAQGIGGGNQNGNIFKIRYDIDFDPAVGIAKPELGPCAAIIADGRFPGNTCPTNTLGMNISILSPIPHEIQARTGKKFASLLPGGTPLVTVDIIGNEATNGQYLFPLGANLGGIAFPEFVEIDLNAVNKANAFSGIPWNLDRRLSPGGCDGPCEGTPQPLNPFPFEGYDPRIQAAIPAQQVPVCFSNNTVLPLVRNRIISYVSGVSGPAFGKFDGPNTLLAWPPADPGPQGIQPTIPVQLTCTATGGGGTVPAQSVSLNAVPAIQQNIGGLVTFDATNVIPPGNYEYHFMLRPIAGDFTTVQAYSTSPQWIWDTTGSTFGDYVVRVDVRAVGSTATREAFATLNYTLATGPATSVALTADPLSPQTVGTAVTFTAANVQPAGGDYVYRFRLRDVAAGTSLVVQRYSSSPQWIWDTTTAVPGAYEVIVDVRASTSTQPFDARARLDYTLN